jgi:hypothetical protein
MHARGRIGQVAESDEHFHRALDLFGDRGNRHGEASAWDTVGYVNHHLGAHAHADATAYQRAPSTYLPRGRSRNATEPASRSSTADDPRVVIGVDPCRFALTLRNRSGSHPGEQSCHGQGG